jgi:hypothetical protein
MREHIVGETKLAQRQEERNSAGRDRKEDSERVEVITRKNSSATRPVAARLKIPTTIVEYRGDRSKEPRSSPMSSDEELSLSLNRHT